MSFPPCYLQLPLLTNFTPPSPSKSGLKKVCIVNNVYGNLKSENSQDYARKPQGNWTFMNSASVATKVLQTLCSLCDLVSGTFTLLNCDIICSFHRLFNVRVVDF
jgi:hypothetical protein